MVAHTTLWQRLGAWIYDPFLWLGERLGMARHRRELLAHADGRVLEIGAGTGLNGRHYRDSIEELVLTEPVEPMAAKLEWRVDRLGPLARVYRAPAETLTFVDHSFDTVVSTRVLCTVEDPVRALSEIARVLPPGGRLLFIEHLRSDTERSGRWQDRLERPWASFGCGCRCNRRTLELIEQSPLRLEASASASWHGMPPLVRPLTIGGRPHKAFARFQRAAAPPETAAAHLAFVYSVDVADELARIHSPTLALHRREDRAIRARSRARGLGSGRPLLTLEGTDHLPWRDAAAAIAAAVGEFLDGDAGAGAQLQARRLEARGERVELPGLSDRELEVLRLVAAGLKDAEIAERLVLSPHTVHRHVANVRTKLRQPSRAAAVAQAGRLGLI